MSGHSKWHNIRVKKMASSSARGKIFTRHARLIEIAAREGGGEPFSNAKLRQAIDAAREDNVPNINIERAVKKGTGELRGEAVQEILYEAYGPGGTAFLIECLTDNKNRTLGNLRVILTKHGGKIAKVGSVQWLFHRRGIVSASCPPNVQPSTKRFEMLQLQLIDAGAEEIDSSNLGLAITAAPMAWPRICDLLRRQQCGIHSAGLAYVPEQKVLISDPTVAREIVNLLENLDRDDDVSEVHTNADIAPDLARRLTE